MAWKEGNKQQQQQREKPSTTTAENDFPTIFEPMASQKVKTSFFSFIFF